MRALRVAPLAARRGGSVRAGARAGGSWALLLALLGSAGVARAQTGPERVEAAEAHYRSAEFDDALDALRGAERGDDLDADDLVALLRLRALVHFANDDTDAMRATLRRLAAFAPDAGPGDVPPPVQAAYDEAREGVAPVTLDVEVEEVPGGVQVRARVPADPEGLVREVRVAVRAPDGWREAEGGPVMVPAVVGASVEYRAEAVGPGGAPVATRGTTDAPLSHVVAGASGEPDEPMADDVGVDPVVIGVLIAAGVVAVAVAVLVAVLVAGSSAAPVQLGPPALEL